MGVLTKLQSNLFLIDKQIHLYDNCLHECYIYLKKLKKKIKRKHYKFNKVFKNVENKYNYKDKNDILDSLFLDILTLKSEKKELSKYIKNTKIKLNNTINKHNVFAKCIYYIIENK